MNRIVIGALAIAIALAAAAQTPSEADRLLIAAKNAELVDGNLKEAIKQYGAIVSKYRKSDRATAAMALVRMAESYRKMGDAQAQALFEQVVKDFADQKEAVSMATAMLGRATSGHEMSQRAVWSGPDASADSVSADGRYVSYSPDEGIHVHDLQTGEDRVLDNDPDPKEPQTAAETLDSTISKDGKLVAYSWWIKDDTYEVRIANTNGKPNPRRLYNAGPDIQWLAPYDFSPDGKWVAVELASEQHGGQIVLVSVPDGAVRPLKALPSKPNVQRMRFSPDGKYLAYDWAVNGRQRVIIQPVDGGPEIVAADFRGENQMIGWAPDGRLLFANDRTGEMTLFALPFSNGKVAGEPDFLTVIGKTSPVGVTQSGTLFYQLHGNVREGSYIVTAPLDPISGKLLSAPQEVTKGELGNIVPSYSPDGKYLAYMSGSLAANPENRVIKIQPVEGGETARVLPLSLRGQFAMSWTPDSRALLFTGTDPSDHSGLFRIDAQTGAATLVALFEKLPSSMAALSPDGKTLYFPSTGKEKAIIARDLATGAEKDLIRRPDLLGTRLSPDGRYIVTPSYDAPSNSRTLLLIPTAGGEPREVMRVPAGVVDDPSSRYMKGNSLIGVSWAGDSRSFYTRKRSADRKKQDEVWQVFLDGQPPRQLEPTIANNVVAGGWSISPDGRHIAYTLIPPPQHRDPSVWVLENFLRPVAKR